MLYPLSYGGARAKSSDLGVPLGGREWPSRTRASRTPVRPVQEHAGSGS